MFNIEYLFTIIKFSLLFYLISKFGFIYGIITMISLFYIRYYLILWVFGLQKLGNNDVSIISDDLKYRSNLIVVFLFDDYNETSLKEHITNGLKSIRKFRLLVKKAFFNYYWRELNKDEIPKRIHIVKDYKNDEEFLNHCKAEINSFIDIFNELPYTVEIARIGKEEDKKGGIMFKMDHIVSDGLGIVSALCAMADNYNPSLFPKVFQNNTNISFFKKVWNKILVNLSFIIYGPYFLYQSQIIKGCKTPMKEPTKPIGNTYFSFSKQHDLSIALKNCKELKITFNDMMVSVISLAFKRLCIDMGYVNVDHFDWIMTIGRNSLPKDIDDLDMGNYSAGMHVEIPVINSFKEGYPKISTYLRKQLKHVGLANAIYNITEFLNEFFPMEFNFKLGDNFMTGIDMFCSNVPGPTKQLIYSGNKIRTMFPLISTGRLKTFVPIVSYNGKYMVLIALNEAINIDKEKFINYLNDEIESLEKGSKVN
jgi:hypothetical protein